VGKTLPELVNACQLLGDDRFHCVLNSGQPDSFLEDDPSGSDPGGVDRLADLAAQLGVSLGDPWLSSDVCLSAKLQA
jgi:hypothetical protein